MKDTTTGVVRAVFGVIYFGDEYEAQPGYAEFKDGKLIGVQIGRTQSRFDANGLTAGFTILPDLKTERSEPTGFIYSRAVNRVYVNGVLDSETDLGAVKINTAQL